jgi:hypothetical protein
MGLATNAHGITWHRRASAEQTRTEEQTIPVIKLDNLSDAFATQLTVEYGKKPGEQLVLETVRRNCTHPEPRCGENGSVVQGLRASRQDEEPQVCGM